MKESLQKTFLVAALLLLYGVGVGLLGAGFALPNQLGTAEQEGHYTASTLHHVIAHTPQSESAVAHTLHPPCQLIKEGKYFAGVLPVYNASIQHTFKFLERFSKGLLLNLRKAELLYPAHFFW